MDLKKLNDIKQGKFDDVLKWIVSNKIKLDEVNSVKIVVCCCSACNDVQCNNTICSESLYNLLKRAEEEITDLTDVYLLKYFRSVFYILRFLLDKHEFEIILRMKNIIIPKCLPAEQSEDVKPLYRNIGNIIHNAIVNISEKENSGISYRFKLCLLVTEISLNTEPINMPLIISYFKSFVLQTNFENRCNYFLTCIKHFSRYVNKENRITMYKPLLECLKITIAKFDCNDFCNVRKLINSFLTFICSTNALLEHKQQFELLQMMNKMIYAANESDLNKIVVFCQNQFSKLDINDEIFSEYCHLLCIILFNLFDYFYKSVSIKVWRKLISVDNQVILYKFMMKAGDALLTTTIDQYVCAEYCKSNSIISHGLCTIAFVGYMTKLSLSEKPNDILLGEGMKGLELCCKHIRKLKQVDCFNWKTLWVEIGILNYNIAVTLLKLKSTYCSKYMSLFIKNLTFLEGVKESCIKSNILESSFTCLTESYLHQKEFRKAFTSTAINIFLNNNDSAFEQWLRIKSSLKSEKNLESHLCEFTVVGVLMEDENSIKILYPDFKLDVDISIQLLMSELERYKVYWPSKIPMKTVLQKLEELADEYTLAKVIVKTWGNLSLEIHDDVILILDTTLNQLQSQPKQPQDQLYLAYLYFLQYKYKKIKEPLPAFSNLVMTNYQMMLQCLHKALNAFDIVIKSSFSNKLLHEENIYSVIVQIAEEFQLHCFSLQALQAWNLSYEIATLLNNNIYKLQSISYILNLIDMESGYRLLEVANNILSLDDFKSSENSKIMVLLILNKCYFYLKQQDVVKAQAEFNDLHQYMDQLNDQDDLLKVRVLHLESHFLLLPCDLQFQQHKISSQVFIQRMMDDIITYCKLEKRNPSTCQLFFEISNFIACWYKWLRLPRELKCYTQVSLELAQKLMVPMRYAQLLLNLAYADLLSMKYDDCHSKINCLSTVLCLPSSGIIFKDSLDVQNSNIGISEKNRMENECGEVMLDASIVTPKVKIVTSSKVHFEMPLFLSHSEDCDCFFCTSIDYQGLVLETFNLDAQLNAFIGNIEFAQSLFFQGLSYFRNIVSKKDTFLRKVKLLIKDDFILDTQSLYCDSYCVFLLNYGNHLVRKKDMIIATKTNKELLNLIIAKKYRNVYLYNEALVQQLCILLSQHFKCGIDNSKTPESKCSKVSIFHSGSKKLSSPEPNIKSIAFDKLSVTDYTDKFKTSPVVTPKVHPKRFLEISDELYDDKNDFKTSTLSPIATPKVKPYPKSFVTTRKKKAVETLPNLVTTPCDKYLATRESLFLIPVSPDAYTPNANKVMSKIELNLAQRTKELTKKIKKSSVSKSNGETKVSVNTRIKTSVRKNLASELAESFENLNILPKQNNTTELNRNFLNSIDNSKVKKVTGVVKKRPVTRSVVKK